MRSLRVAVIAPPWFPVPPTGYGGTELVVHLLATELSRRGHRLTVLGAAGSDPDLNLLELAEAGWSADLGGAGQGMREATYLHRVYQKLPELQVDVIHDHVGVPSLAIRDLLEVTTPCVSTMHGNVTQPLEEFLDEVNLPVGLVAISAFQRASAPDLDWVATVHNAVDPSRLGFSEHKEPYLVQMARITPDKGQHHAIEVAERVNMRLVLAGKVDRDRAAVEYFTRHVQPHLGRRVEWREDVGGRDKADLLANATALLFPIQWDEPFGLAMVEAMVSGTPAIAFRRGAASELIEEGVTGFLADDVDDMVAKVGRAAEIDHRRCAERARERFSVARMADGYEQAYLRAIAAA
ncbi:MAG: glycosyltransferase family 4 protein [Chloroflexota bacterium]